MNANFIIVQYVLPVMLVVGEFFFFGWKNGFMTNVQLSFTGFMIIQLIPIMVGNYFRSKSEA
jgi:hypothetical protein